MLSEQDIEEFRQIYKKEYGEEITKSEAAAMASRVMELYKLLSRRLPGEGPDASYPHEL